MDDSAKVKNLVRALLRSPLFSSAISLTLLGLGLFLFGGRFALEKTLQALIAPAGLLWLGLLLNGWYALRCGHRQFANCSLILFCFLTIAGNQLVARGLVWTLERPFAGFRFAEQAPLKQVIVLGGSTGTTLSGDPQGGDRVLTAIRLWHSGKVNRIICSGSQFITTAEFDQHPGEEAKQLLIEAGVPAELISFNPGLNTSSEFKSLRESLGNPKPTELGIITSASHLRRAMRLAEQEGFLPVAIPASFSAVPYQPAPDLLIPSASNLSVTQACIHEHLGWLLGR